MQATFFHHPFLFYGCLLIPFDDKSKANCYRQTLTPQSQRCAICGYVPHDPQVILDCFGFHSLSFDHCFLIHDTHYLKMQPPRHPDTPLAMRDQMNLSDNPKVSLTWHFLLLRWTLLPFSYCCPWVCRLFPIWPWDPWGLLLRWVVWHWKTNSISHLLDPLAVFIHTGPWVALLCSALLCLRCLLWDLSTTVSII